ncbi:MAG: pilus assembly protein PilB [Planctomycetes bacterium]|nr:pilus assembly protein PilB [Planctomycetota bacterium]
MTEIKRRLLGQILRDMKACGLGAVQEALAVQMEKGGLLGELLLEQGAITRQQLLAALAEQAGMPAVDLEVVAVQPEAAQKVDAATMQAFQCVPWKLEGRVLHVALANPLNTQVLTDIGFMTGLEVRGALASDKAIAAALKRLHPVEENLDDFLDGLGADASKGIDDPVSAARSAPVVRLLNHILVAAIRDRSSDIHFEPFEEEFRVRYRIDGTLFELRSPPRHLAVALLSRIKVLANLDIAEVRVPQDGRIELMVAGRSVDIRVSTLPTMFGESCVLRILDRSVVRLDLANLGLRADDLVLLKDLIDRPHGIVLVTGPTGSGKTTTLYSALNAVNDEGIKIITTEDPVEYDLDGIVQVQVNEEIGVTYAACLRSILRQDPDKVLVGEVRDKETAQIAVEAALTGHLVFTTLHTNDAPSAVTRLVDIGVAPYLVAATLEGIVAQRLVRRICMKCREWNVPSDEVLYELGLTRETMQDRKFACGRGCAECNGTGFKGRMALFEMLVVDDQLAQAIVEGVSLGKFRDLARERGMRTLRDNGLLAIFDGQTTPEEVVRETLATF